ncbi:MAG: DNA polymerase IV [Flavobacteriales bacterium]|jgi:DNA polymerase-4
MSAERAILHLDLDTFFVSVERLLDRRLAGKPLLIGGTGDRGVVAACSYETRAFGVHSGMPMRQARAMCPEAIVIRGNTQNYMRHSEAVTDIVREAVPVCEKTSIDEFYADLTGLDRFFGCGKFARELRERVVRETGLPISTGLSTSKTVSKMATGEAKPAGALHIHSGTERTFLGPLSIRKIPSVGTATFHTLRNLGIRRIHTVQDMPPDLLEQVLGANGRMIWRKAHGIDPSPVIPFSERKSISTERTFARDTADLQRIRPLLIAMAENLAYQLRRGRRLTASITVKVRYADFDTRTLTASLPYTAADHLLVPRVLELFDRLFDRRVLVRLIGVKYSHLVSGGCQMDLFNDTGERVALYQALDRIRDRFGDRSIVAAAGLEARTIGRPNPFDGSAPLLLANRHH